mgnify:FL=1
MNFEKEINEIKNIVEITSKVKDINKINSDIKAGKELLRTIDNEKKQKYLEKIEFEYARYIIALNAALNIRNITQGNGTTRKMINLDEKITQAVRLLELILDEKLFEELVKVINKENNVFCGGVLNE